MTCKIRLQWESLQFAALTSLCTSAIFCHNQNKSVRNMGLDLVWGPSPFISLPPGVSAPYSWTTVDPDPRLADN